MIKAFVYKPADKQLAFTVLKAKTMEGIYRMARNMFNKTTDSYRIEFHNQDSIYGVPFKISVINENTNYRGQKR